MTATDVLTLSRSYPFEQTSNDGLTLEGYAAVFNSPTRINNSWEGDFTETIAKGAFARAVRQNPKPKIQFDHGQHPLLGSIPIASLTSMREDDKGLFISARIHDNWLTEPVRDAIRSGAIDGMSFRFRPADGGETWEGDTRTLTDLDVFEFGPVVFPAYAGTEVTVRSQQLAEALRDTAVRHDLAVALLIDNLTDSLPTLDEPDTRATDDVPPVEDEPEVRDDNQADQDTTSSAPNLARYAATSFALRAEQARLRSTTLDDTNGLFEQG